MALGELRIWCTNKQDTINYCYICTGSTCAQQKGVPQKHAMVYVQGGESLSMELNMKDIWIPQML